MLALARLVRLVALAVVGIIALAIVLRLLNVDGGVVHAAGSWLAGPFRGLLDLDGAKLTMAVNWGIAAIVYAIAAGVVHRLLAGADGHGARRPTIA